MGTSGRELVVGLHPVASTRLEAGQKQLAMIYAARHLHERELRTAHVKPLCRTPTHHHGVQRLAGQRKRADMADHSLDQPSVFPLADKQVNRLFARDTQGSQPVDDLGRRRLHAGPAHPSRQGICQRVFGSKGDGAREGAKGTPRRDPTPVAQCGCSGKYGLYFHVWQHCQIRAGGIARMDGKSASDTHVLAYGRLGPLPGDRLPAARLRHPVAAPHGATPQRNTAGMRRANGFQDSTRLRRRGPVRVSCRRSGHLAPPKPPGIAQATWRRSNKAN